MATHKSAKKRAKQSVRKSAQNKSYMSMVKSLAKNFHATLGEFKAGKVKREELDKAFVNVQSAMAKAAAKGRLTKNKVARGVSRLASMMTK